MMMDDMALRESVLDDYSNWEPLEELMQAMADTPTKHPTPPPIGHNRAPSNFVDPGPATDFIDLGPLAVQKDIIDPKGLAAFYDGTRSQGSDGVRQAALSNASARVRADPDVSHQEYRVFEQINSRCRWQFRYHCEPMQAAAFFSASDAKNLRRPVDKLVSRGFLRRVYLPRRSGGRPMPFLTVVCSAEDRSGETLAILRREATRRSIPCDIPDDEPNRHHDDLQTVITTSSPQSNPHDDGLQTLTMTGANPHHDAHTVEVTVERECRDSEVFANDGSHEPEPTFLVVDEVKPTKRKGRANGMRQWEWIKEGERRELFEKCKLYADARGWSPEFLAARLKAFSLQQKKRPIPCSDWWAALELWLDNPNYQPRASRGAGRKSFAEIAAEQFDIDGDR